MAKLRPLDPCERFSACSFCTALPGQHCRQTVNGEETVPYSPHLERKRAEGRRWRTAQIFGVVSKYRNSSKTSTEIADLIDDALHPTPGILGPAPKTRKRSS